MYCVSSLCCVASVQFTLSRLSNSLFSATSVQFTFSCWFNSLRLTLLRWSKSLRCVVLVHFVVLRWFTSSWGVGPIHFVVWRWSNSLCNVRCVGSIHFVAVLSSLCCVASRRFTSMRFVVQFTSSDFTASVRRVASFKFTLLPWLSSLPCVHFLLRRVALVHFVVSRRPIHFFRIHCVGSSCCVRRIHFVTLVKFTSSRSLLVASRCVGSLCRVASIQFTSSRRVVQFTSSDFTALVRCVASVQFTLLLAVTSRLVASRWFTLCRVAQVSTLFKLWQNGSRQRLAMMT